MDRPMQGSNFYKNGLKAEELIKILKCFPKDTPIIISSDEEHNNLYSGVCIDKYAHIAIISGLSGCEYEE